MKAAKSNIKYHNHGVITWTVETELWWPKSSSSLQMDRGWGNGYIAIPEDHPFISRCKELLKQQIIKQIDEMVGLRSLYIPNIIYDLIPAHPNQEWTYGEHETIEDEDINTPAGQKYYIFGFDCNHSWNNMINSPEEKVVSWIEEYVPIVNQ